MTGLRKITVHLPSDLVEDAQAATGAGVTETIRQGLEQLKRAQFYNGLKALRGKVDFSDFDLEELREDKVYDWDEPKQEP